MTAPYMAYTASQMKNIKDIGRVNGGFIETLQTTAILLHVTHVSIPHDAVQKHTPISFPAMLPRHLSS